MIQLASKIQVPKVLPPIVPTNFLPLSLSLFLKQAYSYLFFFSKKHDNGIRI